MHQISTLHYLLNHYLRYEFLFPLLIVGAATAHFVVYTLVLADGIPIPPKSAGYQGLLRFKICLPLFILLFTLIFVPRIMLYLSRFHGIPHSVFGIQADPTGSNAKLAFHVANLLIPYIVYFFMFELSRLQERKTSVFDLKLGGSDYFWIGIGLVITGLFWIGFLLVLLLFYVSKNSGKDYRRVINPFSNVIAEEPLPLRG